MASSRDVVMSLHSNILLAKNTTFLAQCITAAYELFLRDLFFIPHNLNPLCSEPPLLFFLSRQYCLQVFANVLSTSCRFFTATRSFIPTYVLSDGIHLAS